MKFCPECGADLTPYLGAAGSPKTAMRTTNYDQTATWKALVKDAQATAGEPPSPMDLVGAVSLPEFRGEPVSSIVHLVFDRAVVPAGGVLLEAAQRDGQMSTSPEHLEAMGYVVEDGKVKVVNHVPIGQAYQVLDYWGGGKQFPRWHLTKPVDVVAGRKGDPFFMDSEFIAFGATWKDAERFEKALLELLDLFVKGIRDGGRVAIPLALKVVWQ